MAAIFFAILALLGIWGTFILNATGNLGGFTFSLVAAVAATVFVTILTASWFVFKKLKARAASKELDKTLNAQADDQEANARPDLQPQIQEMRAEFQKAVGSLKSSRLGRTGADALSVMPWYVIIGPPGTGKSTALRNSGLKFPYLGKKGGVRGVGGTRNCDWWLTNEGVILDTAGRYVTEEDDQEEWLSFLDAVAKSRPKRPINGLIVTVAASDLLTLDEPGAAALGAQLRERVDEVTGRLHLLVPVYLLVTKCDLLSGFVETYGNLPKSERGQVWGFTFPVGASHEDGPGELVKEKLDELTDVLFERSVGRLAQERKMESREKIFRFPRQLQLLRAGLGEVAQAVFSENPYQDTPLLRGVYFTSGTQEGRPIDKVMSAMAESFGLRAALPAGEAPTDARSYFLGGLFTEVIFKDFKLARRSSRAVQLQRQRRVLYAAVAAGVSALLIVWPLLSFSAMRSEAKEVVEKVKDVAKVTYPEDRLLRLEALRAEIRKLQDEQSSTVSGIGSFGMNRREELLKATLPVYGQWMRDLVVMDVLKRDEEALAALPEPGSNAPVAPALPRRRQRRAEAMSASARAAPSSASNEPFDEEVTFERLKRHMLLSLLPNDPPARQPDLFVAELQSLGGPMAADFKKTSSVSPSEDDISKDLALLFDIWPEHHNEWKVERKESLKAKGQGSLSGMNRTRRMLELQLRRWAKGKPDLTLTAMVRDGSVYESDRVVRAAFTKEIWKDKAKDALAKPPSDDEAWILGATPQTGEQIQQDLQREYYGQYIREWTNMMSSVELRPVRDPNEVRRRLEALTDPEQSPLKDLFEKMQENVLLEVPVPRSKPVVPDARSVSEAFVPLIAMNPGLNTLLSKVLPGGGRERVDLNMYMGRLKGFAKDVEAAKDPAAAALVAKTLRAEAGNLSSVISNQQKGSLYEQVLEQVWVKPVRKMADALDSGTRQELNFKWCSDVYALHRSELKGRYPFARMGQDADLATLIQLYNGKDGKLVEFYKNNLSSKVGDRGQDYVRVGGESVVDSLITYLNRAKVVREALFPSESPEPLVDFSVQLHPPQLPNVLGVNFLMDDQQARQDTGPVEQPYAMHWPGSPKGPKRALLSLTLKGARPKVIGCHGEQECSGTFALFRLLEQGKVLAKGARSATLSWPVELGAEGVTEVRMDIYWTRSVSPWFGREGGRSTDKILAIFHELEPPAAIVPGVEGCR